MMTMEKLSNRRSRWSNTAKTPFRKVKRSAKKRDKRRIPTPEKTQQNFRSALRRSARRLGNIKFHNPLHVSLGRDRSNHCHQCERQSQRKPSAQAICGDTGHGIVKPRPVAMLNEHCVRLTVGFRLSRPGAIRRGYRETPYPW